MNSRKGDEKREQSNNGTRRKIEKRERKKEGIHHGAGGRIKSTFLILNGTINHLFLPPPISPLFYLPLSLYSSLSLPYTLETKSRHASQSLRVGNEIHLTVAFG